MSEKPNDDPPLLVTWLIMLSIFALIGGCANGCFNIAKGDGFWNGFWDVQEVKGLVIVLGAFALIAFMIVIGGLGGNSRK